MTELKGSGQTALRARAKRKEAQRIEAQARAESDDAEYRALMERAAKIKDEAIDLEKASRWFAYLDRMEMIGKNKGEQTKTVARREFLRKVAREIGTTKRQSVCLAAQGKPEFHEMFDNYEQAHRFAKPAIFDGIQKPSKAPLDTSGNV